MVWGFPSGSEGKETTRNAGDTRGMGSIPSREDSLDQGTATHSSILAWRNFMDRGAWCATVHRVTKSWTLLEVT